LSPSLHLNNVLVSPQLIKNLISVRQFTIDNNCSVEVDPSGCSTKDPLTGTRSQGTIAPGCCTPCVSLLPPSPLWPPHPLALASPSRSSWS
jgi:hypothetical protein